MQRSKLDDHDSDSDSDSVAPDTGSDRSERREQLAAVRTALSVFVDNGDLAQDLVDVCDDLEQARRVADELFLLKDAIESGDRAFLAQRLERLDAGDST
jgi:hypothetical protein